MRKNKIKLKRKSSAKRKVVIMLASLLFIGLILMGGYLFFNNSSLREYSNGNTFSNWLTGATVGIEETGSEGVSIEEISIEDLIIQTEATSTTCGTISANLILTANITNNTICFTIGAHNIALDCDGYGVTGNGGASYAVTNTGGYDNIIIRDCSFVSWGRGINLGTSASINDLFENNTFINATLGIYLDINSQAIILNNTFKSSSDTDAIYFNNGDNSNVTNNTFEGDYSEAAIYFNGIASSSNNVWQNKFLAADGVTDSGTSTNFCVDNTMGNFYNGSVAVAQIQADDCGPTPNGTVNVNQSLTAQQFGWAGGDANYTDLRTGVYNLYNAPGKNIVYLKENHNTSYGQSLAAVETVRNDVAINCMGFQYGDSKATSTLQGITVNAENGIKIFNCTINNFDLGIYITTNGVMAISNNTFIANGGQDAIYFNNGDSSNVTNNTFEGDYTEAGIFFNSVASSSNNIWQNKFLAADGITDGGTGTTLCVSGMGNFYNSSVALAQVPTPDCGPTPNSSVYVTQSLATASWSFSTSPTANPIYNDLQEAYYNNNRYQTIFLQTNYSKTSLTQTIRNNTILDCQNYNFSASSVALKITGANWNKVKNCDIRTTGTSNYGIHLLTSVGNELINNIINASGTTAYGVYFQTNANHNQVINTTFLGSAANDVYTSSSSNNTLINTSFARGDFGFLGTADILVKWYVNVNVTDGINSLNLANVGIYNNTVGLLYSGTTDTSGTTGKQILQEFIQSSATAIIYSTPHNITGNKTGYNPNSTLINLTQTNSTTILLILPVSNTAPNTISVILNATSINNYTTDNLTCYTNITDADGGNVYANYTWYKNNITNLSGQNGPYASGTLNLIANLSFGNTTKNEQWICSIMGYDGTAYETDWNNASIVIRDSPPTVPSLDLPFNNTNTSDNTPFFNWTISTDADNDAITYRIEIANDTAFTQYAQINTSIPSYSNYTALTLGDKTYYWRVESNTSDANSSWSEWRAITIDTITPVVSWINPTNYSNYTKNTFNITFNTSVLELNFVQSVLFSFDNSSGTNFNVTAINGSGSWAAQYNVSSLAEGTHFVNVIANDSAGNINNTQQISFIIDNTAPRATWITPTNNSNYSRTAYNQTFNLSVFEENFVQSVLFSFDNASGNNFNVTASNGSGYWSTQYNVSSLAEGTHFVNVIANDSAGNINNTQQISFTTDFTPPTASWITPTNGSNYSRTSYNQTFNVSIADLAAQTVLFSFDNATGNKFNVTASNGSGYWAASVNVSGLKEGSHIITIIANDSAGNINNNQLVNFVVDFTVPGVNWITPANQQAYSATAYNQTFNLSISETNFVNRVLLSFNNATGIPFNVTASNGSGYWSASVNISGLPEGTHIVTAIANDSAGNINNTEQRTFTLDKTAPVVSWINPTNYSNYTKNTFNITFNASVLDLSAQAVLFSFDNASGNNFNITTSNGSGYWSAQYNVSSLAEGTHTVIVIANDSVGNVNNLQTIIFTVDNTAPIVSWISPTNGSNFTKLSYNQTFNISILELNFVQSVLFSFDNASGNNFNVTAINGSGSWTAQYNVSSLAEGTHFVNVIANDSAGNINNTQQISFIIDNTAPRATWVTPANNSNYSRTAYNQTFNLSIFELNFVQSVLFSFDNASGTNFNVTATNGSGSWAAQYNISALAEGVQTITAIANDSTGNKNNTQQITITTDFTAPTFTNAKNTSINFKRYQNFTANITINDNIIGLQHLIFSANASGIWDNSTNLSISGLQYNASLSKNITLPKGGQVCWYYWINDSLGNKNQSTENCFTVINTQPRFNETLTDKSVTVGNDLNYKINCSDVDTDTITYYDNTTLFDINALTGLISDTPVAGDAGSYPINITCGDGEENVSQKFTYTITTVPVPTPAPSGGGGGGTAAAGCVKDTDCKAEQYCQNSICYDYECTSNKQCEKDKYCVNHNCLKIFDLKILQVDSPIQPGEFLDFSYFMKGMANISGDVTLNFWLEKGIEKATSGTDVIFMGNFEEKIEESNLFLPSTMEEGKYKFNIKLTFDGYEIISSRLVEVMKETPLLVSFTILDLPKIEGNKPWDYSAILSVNKDEPLPLNLKQKIMEQDKEVWFKESNLILEKSIIITEKISGLDTGKYTLELEAVYGSETVSAKQSFVVGEPKAEAIAGAATGGIREWINKSWPVLLGLLLVILISILISTLMRKKEEEPSLERLERWVDKMNELGKSKEEIRILIVDTGWSDQELETVFRKVEKTQEIKNSSNFSDEDLKKLGDFIYAQHKNNTNKEEVMRQLVEAGWPKKVVDKFLTVYYG